MATRKKSEYEVVTPAMIGRLKVLRKSCGLRKFISSKERSYNQWKNEAENLIIRLFGEKSNQLT